MTNTYREFFTEVLKKCGLPVYEGALHALYAVSTLEGLQGTEHSGPQRFNPLNSVVQHGDSTAFNSVGVQDYKSFDNGVAGTVELLKGAPWHGVGEIIHTRHDTDAVLDAFAEVYQGWEGPSFTAARFPRNPTLGNFVMTEHGPVEETNTPHPPPPPHEPKHHASGDKYTVRRGDTLWGIARRYYGDGRKYELIVKANHLPDANIIHPGDVLTLPKDK